MAPFGTHCPCSAFTCNTPCHGHLSTPINSNPRRLIATRESMIWTGHHLFHLPSAAGCLDRLQSCTVRWLVICRAYCTRIRRLTHDYFIMIHPWEGISVSQGVSISNLLQHSPKWPSKNLVSWNECGVPGPRTSPAPTPASSRRGNKAKTSRG